jgi:putative flavoprotein involved in K+ transport
VATESVETLIIGGGQAGLVMSHMLSKRGRPHLVLERARIAERWKSERWDDLRFQLPNWSVHLPDYAFPHTDPDGFAFGHEIARYLDAYADFVAAPVRCGVEVTALRGREGGQGFLAETPGGSIEAANVVVATGPSQSPVVPPTLPEREDILQLHANAYRNPGQLPDGAVLVVGCGASGSQIADELNRAGRQVYLSVGAHQRLPRRYRGRDLIWWWNRMGVLETPPEKRLPGTLLPPVIGGAYGPRYTIDFRDFATRGVVLLGRAQKAREGVMTFAPGLPDQLTAGDATYLKFLDSVDAFVSQQALHVPLEPDARVFQPMPLSLAEAPSSLDLRAAGVGVVIWATGYQFALDWIHLPITDERGQPLHYRGVTEQPGLYFLGFGFLSSLYSSFLSGVGIDAARLADHIVARG